MRYLTILLGLLSGLHLFGQAPDAFSYQAVARNAMGDALVNTSVGVRFQLHQATLVGPVVYSETHAPTTNGLGLFALEVGHGTVTQGSFAAIDWSAGPYFLEVGLDASGGANYAVMGTQQLLSVPYALHAKTVDTDNDAQQLSISGDTLFISNGNYIVLPSRYVTDCDDGIQNGDETGVDCGGSVCVSCAALCSDGIQNGDEAGVDCGGSTCTTPCPTCTDGIQNGDETGVDCGGTSCAICVALCTDGIQNGDETGVDCGGTACVSCFSLCSDGIQNGDENGVDCGGSCPPCCVDNDGDGFTTCAGDCNDASALVNPGAFEFVGNGIDDNCDGQVDEFAVSCSASQKFTGVSGTDLAQAMGLCQTTTANGTAWGLISAQQLLANGSTPSSTQNNQFQNEQTAVLTAYGTGGIVPVEGPTFAGLSTGRMRDADDPGFASPSSGTQHSGTATPLPAAYLLTNGGSLPSSNTCVGICPGGSTAFDAVSLRLRIRVPTNANGFSYQFRFFTADYQTASCTNFNDHHLALLSSQAPGLPADLNIALDAQGNTVSVNGAFMEVCVPNGCRTCPSGNAELTGTGMEFGNVGGGTSWRTVTAPVVPGEVIILDLMIFDVGDGIVDANVLLDNFQWIPTPP